MLRLLASVLIVGALVLTGCSKPASSGSAASPEPVARAVAPPAAGAMKVAPIGPAVPQLAYSYHADVSAPAAVMPSLLARHEAACRQAGAPRCQIIGAERSSDADGAHAELKLRADPMWLQAFRDNLANDVKPAGGKLVGTTTSSEDLTSQIVDTDAALRAKTTLAERLQAMLASREGKLSDLLDVENALAETQGEIDAARSELAVMRNRVATSDLTLSYTSRPAMAGAWRPVGDALNGAAGVFAQGLAAVIFLVAGLLPFAVVASVVVLVWRMRPRRRQRASHPPDQPIP